ncbi:hypothetical protein ACFT8P_33490 [Streptomyces sp. NPDC057101]|uniref:hypothetical protein n=1 Tax=Streptomyces sp. NPDC057101 TaxID=3346020 RepID=UPI0036341DD9
MDWVIAHSIDAVAAGNIANEMTVAEYLYQELGKQPEWVETHPFTASPALLAIHSEENYGKGVSGLIDLVFQQGRWVAEGGDRDESVRYVQQQARVILDNLVIPSIIIPSSGNSDWTDYGSFDGSEYGSNLGDLELEQDMGEFLSGNLALMEDLAPQPVGVFEGVEYEEVTAAERRKLMTMIEQTVALDEGALERMTEASRVSLTVFNLNGATRILIGDHEWEVDGFRRTLDVVAEVKYTHSLFKVKSGSRKVFLVQREQAEGDTAEIKRLLREITSKKINFGSFPYPSFQDMWEKERSEVPWGELLRYMQNHHRDVSATVEFVAAVRKALDNDGGHDEFMHIYTKFARQGRTAEQLFQDASTEDQRPIETDARSRRLIAGSAKRKYAFGRDVSVKEPLVKAAMSAVFSFPQEYWMSYTKYLARVTL